MKATRLVLVGLLAAGLAVISCAKPTTPEPESYFVDSPMPIEEAELMALYLGGEILAPQWLYERVQRDLQTIRTEYGHIDTFLHIVDYYPPFAIASYVTMFIDQEAHDKIKAGIFAQWDSLNSEFRMTDYRLTDGSFTNRVTMWFEGRRNSGLMREQYIKLPGFEGWDEAWRRMPSNIFPHRKGDSLSYLFIQAVQCPGITDLRCYTPVYWYFESNPTGVSYTGSSKDFAPGLPKPDWVQRAKNNLCGLEGTYWSMWFE